MVLSSNNFISNKFGYYLGEEVKSVDEVQEVAKDVVNKIEARNNTMKSKDGHALA